MRYLLITLFSLLSLFGIAQTDSIEANIQLQSNRYQLSVDAGALLINRPNLTFDYTFNDKYAIVFGLQTLAKSSLITFDTLNGIENPNRRFITNAWHRYVVSLGLRHYFGDKQPLRGFWMEGGTLVSIGNRQLDSYTEQLPESIYPMEIETLKTLFGLHGAIGYRHVLKNGISIGGHLAVRAVIDRVDTTNDPLDPNLIRNEYEFGFTATPAFLTVGYVW